MSESPSTVAPEMISDERTLLFEDQQESHIKRVSSRGGDRVATITNLFFKNKHLSKHHATVRYDKTIGFTIEDTNSTFGTVANDRVIKHNVRVPLRDKDTLGFILSKPSLKIKEVFKKFESELEHNSIPLSEFDLPKISMKFVVAINKSVFKLIPHASNDAFAGNDLTNDGSTTNLSTFEATGLENYEVDGEREHHHHSVAEKERKAPLIIIDHDEEHEGKAGDIIKLRTENDPFGASKKNTPDAPIEIESELDETSGEDFDVRRYGNRDLSQFELSDVLVSASKVSENKHIDNQSKHKFKSPTPGKEHSDCDEVSLGEAKVKEAEEEAEEEEEGEEEGEEEEAEGEEEEEEDDGPPSESDIVYEVEEVNFADNGKQVNNEEEEEMIKKEDKPLDNEAFTSRAKITPSVPSASTPEACIKDYLEKSASEDSPLTESTDNEYNSQGYAFEDIDSDSESGYSCYNVEDHKLCHNDDPKADESDLDHSCSSYDSDDYDYDLPLDIPLEEISLAEESVCVRSDFEDSFRGDEKLAHNHKAGLKSSEKYLYDHLEHCYCFSHVSNARDVSGSDEEFICDCSDQGEYYCEEGGNCSVTTKKDNHCKGVAFDRQPESLVTSKHFGSAQLMMESGMNNDQPRSSILSSRKRSYNNMVDGESLEGRLGNDYSSNGAGGDCSDETSVTDMPLRKKHIREDSKVKTIAKEVAKALFYVAATITALGIYGSKLEEN